MLWGRRDKVFEKGLALLEIHSVASPEY